MRGWLSAIVVCASCTSALLAQWQGAGPIYYNGGNVGIGTTGPASMLNVNGGAIQVTGTAGTVPPASGAGLELLYNRTDAIVQGYNRTGSASLPLLLNGSNIAFANNTTEAMRNNWRQRGDRYHRPPVSARGQRNNSGKGSNRKYRLVRLRIRSRLPARAPERGGDLPQREPPSAGNPFGERG
jgi:hypothetical protein